MNGVTGLACAGCGQAVGVINETALQAMLAAEEAYVCTRCQERADIETVLASQPRDYYAHLVSRVLLDAMLVQ